MARRFRPPARATWTEAEDAVLIDMIRCDLATEFWTKALPGRPFGDVANRRLELVEQGRAQLPKLL